MIPDRRGACSMQCIHLPGTSISLGCSSLGCSSFWGVYLGVYLLAPRSGELRTQKLWFYLLRRTQSSKVLSLKPGVGRYIAIPVTPTARDFSLVNFYPCGSFTCIFRNLSWVFPVLAVANTGCCVDPQNRIGHPAHCYRQLIQAAVLRAHGIQISSKTCVCGGGYLGWCSKIVDIIWEWFEKKRLLG